MLAILTSASLQGIDAELVHVEVNTGEAGAPDLVMVDRVVLCRWFRFRCEL